MKHQRRSGLTCKIRKLQIEIQNIGEKTINFND